jgi:uncharacterized repeat protein (TIGR03847 family)
VIAYYDIEECYPVRRITAGAVGEPGQRTFILQAQVEGQTISLVIEKEQAVALSRSIPKLLEQVRDEYPELAEPLVAARPNLALHEPVDPIFRVASIQLEYDRLHDLIVLTLADAGPALEAAGLELLDDELDDISDGLPALDDEEDLDPDLEDDEDEPADIQIYTTRGQALLLGRQAEMAVVAGRPACPNCGEPMDDFGHFCLPPMARRKSDHAYLQ